MELQDLNQWLRGCCAPWSVAEELHRTEKLRARIAALSDTISGVA
jgi:hypothetical protein